MALLQERVAITRGQRRRTIARRLRAASMLAAIAAAGLGSQAATAQSLRDLRNRVLAMHQTLAPGHRERASAWEGVVAAHGHWTTALRGTRECPSEIVRATERQLQQLNVRLETQFRSARALSVQIGQTVAEAEQVASRGAQAQRINNVAGEAQIRRDQIRLIGILLDQNRRLTVASRDLEDKLGEALAAATDFVQRCTDQATMWELLQYSLGRRLRVLMGGKEEG